MLTTRECVVNDFILRSTKEKDPFFLYLAFPSPHTPWVPTPEFLGKTEVGPYGDFTTMVDAMVGKILQTIDSLELRENTLVVFTSDNGPFWTPALVDQYDHRSAGSWRGMKADAWEGGHRIPFVARWPGKIKTNTTSNALISLTSLYATCADMLGISIDDQTGEDSHSIWPVLTSEVDVVPGQEALVQQSSKNFLVVRKDEWKYITGIGSGGFSEPSVVNPEDGQAIGQLYNLNNDPSEDNNLFLQMPDKVSELSALLQRYKNQGHSR